jgi:hypothetical protein
MAVFACLPRNGLHGPDLGNDVQLSYASVLYHFRSKSLRLA